MNKILALIFICSTAVLSAYCSSGNCNGNWGYYNNSNGYYYNQPYNQGYYDGNYYQPYYRGYYYNQPYYQGYDRYYNRPYGWNNWYSRNDSDVADLTMAPKTVNQPAMAAQSDQDINNAMKQVMISGAFSTGYENISFDVKNGTLTLNGTVNSQELKDRIDQRAHNLPGIKEVVNNITVSNP